MAEGSFPCPCCGHLVFGGPPGSDEICPICYWEDDVVQLRWPDFEGGANHPSLWQAQRNYETFGACDQAALAYVRSPRDEDVIEPGWRILTDADTVMAAPPLAAEPASWPSDLTELYWWRFPLRRSGAT